MGQCRYFGCLEISDLCETGQFGPFKSGSMVSLDELGVELLL